MSAVVLRLREGVISVAQLRDWSACACDRRVADLARHLGRPADDDDGLTVEGWAEVRQIDNSLSASTPDLAWAMMRADRVRCLRALAAVLSAILPDDADPRSRAVIPMLREPERYSQEEWAAAAEAAQAAAVRASWVSSVSSVSSAWAAAEAAAWVSARAVEAAAEAEEAAWAAARANPNSDIRGILLRGWVEGA